MTKRISMIERLIEMRYHKTVVNVSTYWHHEKIYSVTFADGTELDFVWEPETDDFICA